MEAEAVQGADGLLVAASSWVDTRPADDLGDGDMTSLLVESMGMTLVDRRETVVYTVVSEQGLECKQAALAF